MSSEILNKDIIDKCNDAAWELSRISTQQALLNAEELLRQCEITQYIKGLAESHRTIGQCYWLLGIYSEAILHLDKAHTHFKKLNNLLGEAEVLNIYGGVYAKTEDYQKSVTYYEYALKIRLDLNDTEGIVKSMNSIGDSLMKLKKYDQALKQFQSILDFKHENRMFHGIVLYNIAEVYFHLNQIETSNQYISKCRDLGEEMKFELMHIYCDSLAGRIALKANQIDISEQFFQSALSTSLRINNNERACNIHKELANILELKGDYKASLQHYKSFQQLREKLIGSTNLQQLKTLEQKLETDQLKKETQEERQKNNELSLAYQEIESHRNKIAIQNKEISQSIRYAQRIQQAILPSDEMIKSLFPESFVLNLPKDVLSGDFYWVSEVTTDYKEKFLLAAVADCTGHGVPGALMSLIGNNFLRQCEITSEVNTPAEALDFINQGLSKTLRQDTQNTIIQDGMDMSFIAIDYHVMKLYFASAKRTLLLARNGEVRKYNGDSHPVGAYISDEKKHFTNQSIDIQKGDVIYQFTDGYIDQFGGPKGKKFMIKRFIKLISEMSHNSMENQLSELNRCFADWKGDLEQIDDVCVMGIKI